MISTKAFVISGWYSTVRRKSSEKEKIIVFVLQYKKHVGDLYEVRNAREAAST